MKFIPANTSILFLGDTGVGENFGQIGPQIRYFEVMYLNPPVVGFEVVGSDDE